MRSVRLTAPAKRLPYLALPVLTLLAQPTPALAYIDPNIGGQIAQLLTPILTMVVAALAFARHWVKASVIRAANAMRRLFRRGDG